MENVIILPSDFPPAESFLVKDPSITAIERIIDTVADILEKKSFTESWNEEPLCLT